MQKMSIRVKDRFIGYDQPIFLTAEIGASHMGDVELAKEMIREAARAGCDGVDLFMTSVKGYYRIPSPEWEAESMEDSEWKELFRLADQEHIVMYITPLDPESVVRAVALGSSMLNINSDDLNNPFLLEVAARQGVPITCHDISMTLGEMEAAVTIMRDSGCEDFIILHSTLESGVEDMLYETANLKVMDTYKKAFGESDVLVGCVEHTTSDFLIYAVAALNPVLISKHIITRHMPGAPDDEISVDLENLERMVRNVRHCEVAMGQGINFSAANREGKVDDGSWTRHKILVAAHDIQEGAVIKKEDVAAKRPAIQGALHPWMWKLVVGARAKYAIPENEVLNLNMFEEFPLPSYRFYDLERRRFDVDVVDPV